VRYFITTADGYRVSLEQLQQYALVAITWLHPLALEILCRARSSQHVAAYPDVAELADTILASPRNAVATVSAAPEASQARLCIAMALAFEARCPGAWVSCDPEDVADQAYVASVHASATMLQ